VRRADQIVFTTPGTQSMYLQRYAALARERTAVIPNGYGEEDFAAAARVPAARPAHRKARLRLVHSGILYPFERDPKPFLDAVAGLARQGALDPGDVEFVFRATGHDAVIQQMIDERGVGELVRLEGPVSYHEALAEMLEADALLLFQAANCNHQVPAKLYEYLRAGRPIFALTDSRGDTAAVLRQAGAGMVADLSSAGDIAARLPQFLQQVRDGLTPPGNADVIRSFSREAGAAALAALLSRYAR
jgi:glycosyltransferase involved in cell wall biosynthesis